MSKKKEIREVPYITYFCDFCGDGPGDSSYIGACYICGRDTCTLCSKPYDEYQEPNPPHAWFVKNHRWCKHCFKFAAKTGILENFEMYRSNYNAQVEEEIKKFRDYIKKRINT